MNHYESVFILNPALSVEQVNDVIKKYEKILKDNKCNIVELENWGLKKLAYKIQNKLSRSKITRPQELERKINLCSNFLSAQIKF